MTTVGRPARPSRRFGRLLKGRSFATVGFTVLAAYLLLGLIGPFFVSDPLATDQTSTMLAPSGEHWFGTDSYGRDVFARAVHAVRLDVGLGLTISVSAMLVGSAIGVIAGFFGGVVDEIVMRVVDIVLSFPGFILAMVLVAAMGESVPKVAAAVAISFVPQFVRITRASVLSERELEYVDGARLAGNGSWRTAFRHVWPNAMRPSLVQLTLVSGYSILNIAGLAYLGVGIRPPTAEWGVMVSEGAANTLTGQWWTALFPGAMIVGIVMALHFIGDEFDRSQQ
ncbi:ABC transporter permease [Dactylosporangium sp. NPDC000521]|uniref:ABC transporter permease n=1 Tax=Dactylosporangium sp. NPDC000521 TaxID=3363975 RepID=UPI0036BBCB38